MNRCAPLYLAIACLGLAMMTKTASGGFVTWEFGGVITSVDDPLDILGGSIMLGTPFSGSFTFESTTPDSEPNNPSVGSYDDAIVALSGHIGALEFFGAGLFNTIRVFDEPSGFGSDSYSVSVTDLGTPFFGETSDFFLGFEDSTRSAFASDSLPIAPFDLNAFDNSFFSLQTASEQVRLEGTVTSLVPEPATLGLLGMGTVVLLRRRFRRPRNVLPAFVALVTVLFLAPYPSYAQWVGGPVLIGGDDTDEHFVGGRLYMREGFNFLGNHVTSGNTIAVCIGCNGIPASSSFTDAFNDSNLSPLQEGTWTTEILIDPTGPRGIHEFFQNTGDVNIQDTGIIYLPSDEHQVSGGLTQDQLDVINNNRFVLRDFVKVDGGGLFTHTLSGLTDSYLWLEALVPEIEDADSSGGTGELILDCDATATMFANLSCPEIASVRVAQPWHATLTVHAPRAVFRGRLKHSQCPRGCNDPVQSPGRIHGGLL